MTYLEVSVDKDNATDLGFLLDEDPVSSTSGLKDSLIHFELTGNGKCLISYEKYKVVDADIVRQFLGGLR